MLAEHQHVAARRALELLDTRGGLLLADEVGLGKSFVAAEVMRCRGIANELIVPAALVPQWKQTLDHFELQAELTTHDGLLTGRRPWAESVRLVVVDEAHAFRNPGTKRYAALAERTAGAEVMLVTATPLCNSLRDLESLLRLFARDDLLADAGIPSIDAAFERRDRAAIDRIVASLVIRRDRSVVPPELHFGELRRRVLFHTVPPAPEIDALTFPLIGAYSILRRFLRRRLESSEAALVESVQRQLRFYDRALEAIAAGRTLPKQEYRRAFSQQEERGVFQEVLFWDLFAPPGDADPSAIRLEMSRLESLQRTVLSSPSDKRGQLVRLVERCAEPMLVFTGSAATARDLFLSLKQLRRCGLVTARERGRLSVLRAFERGLLDVLITTDLAAEGLNLQRAGVVVHYDIPWNPVKLDQRNGRAHRIGQQRAHVDAVYFLPQTRETRIAETVARKNRVRRRVLDRVIERDRAPASPPTLRPRVGQDSAFARLASRCPDLPLHFARRHRAGIERLLFEMLESRTAEAIAAVDALIARDLALGPGPRRR